FQAEDGIRDKLVTGVQTCALPISKILLDGRNASIPGHGNGHFVKPTVLDALPTESDLADTEIFGPVLSLVHADSLDEALAFLERSEERRVGKECRSGVTGERCKEK